MDWGFLLGLSVITLSIISLLIYGGMKLSRFVRVHEPDSELAMHVTPVGNAFFACVTAILIAGLAAGRLSPGGALGTLLATSAGTLMFFAGMGLCCAIGATILGMLGYPVLIRDESRSGHTGSGRDRRKRP